MWRLRPDRRYLMPPWKGSNHSRGAAVDVTVAWHNGQELKMPTPHDEFSPRAHRGAVRGVSQQARRNADFLDRMMRAEGFLPIPNEWWHFDAPGARRYPLLDLPIR
jgi:D-alanyl-D-alanine dipeptidase